ncbi:dipeptidase [Tepidibacillus fermentans]|uniref:Dipeptidase n=1 Tax=Tepidibacillus fermentans TaxID=1281767 RepID=A0A4R3KHS2_9BACI|nr:dipeptidase [Tepidibacillus fermentans]TCS83027.1 dipeptidase [Tepidibacillus fermentans]
MIFDAHTDVLWKLLNDPSIDFYEDDDRLHVNYPNMIKGKIDLQVFAIYVSPTIKSSKFLVAIQSIDDFYQIVIGQKNRFKLATTYQEIETYLDQDKKVALLSIEGADVLEGDLAKLRTFYRLGVRAMGLTWNQANEVADGIMEPRGAGLTRFGQEVVKEMNRLGMMIDVSHLSERGFWDVIEQSEIPIHASHSNTKKICNHPRNLTDGQIKAIIEQGGVIGVTFVRDFTSTNKEPTIDDLLLHIEHIASLGGIEHIGLGSDFDGANPIKGLENAGKLENLVNVLLKYFAKEHVEGILKQNWLNYYKRVLR